MQVLRAARADFAERKVDEIFPVRRAADHPQLLGAVSGFISAQIARADPPQHAVKLIDGEHGRRRIIDLAGAVIQIEQRLIHARRSRRPAVQIR